MEALFFGFIFFGLPIWLCYLYAFGGTKTNTQIDGYSSSLQYPHRHYVYTHSINGRVFYVGKGFKDRAWSTLSRNYYWWRWVNYYHPNYLREGVRIPHDNDKVVVNIIKDNMHYSNAYEYEKQIIEQYGVDNLTNILKGHDSNKTEYSKQPIPKRF